MNQNNLIPYCIYHYLDLNTPYGSIDNPIKTITPSGNIKYECFNKNKNAVLYNIFYAYSPMIRPIPNGLKLIRSIKNQSYPYSTKSVEYGYDPFNINKQSVSFLTWTQPILNTVPLYIHINPSKYIFPSFDKNPPENDQNWSQADISPIFVLIDPETSGITKDLNGNKLKSFTKDENEIPIVYFSIKDGKCHPDPGPGNDNLTIEKCFLLTDEDLLKTGVAGPITLLQQNKKIDKINEDIFFKFLSPNIITIFLVIFLVSLIICIKILISN